MKTLRETDIVRACLDWFAAMRILAWRSNSGGVMGEYKGKKRFVRFNSAPGMSDICAVYRGRFIAVEVKMPGKHSTPEQIRFQNAVAAAGGLALEVHSTDELAKAMETA